MAVLIRRPTVATLLFRCLVFREYCSFVQRRRVCSDLYVITRTSCFCTRHVEVVLSSSGNCNADFACRYNDCFLAHCVAPLFDDDARSGCFGQLFSRRTHLFASS